MSLFKNSGRNSGMWAFMQRFEIPNLDNPEETYLTRWRIIQTPWFAFYLHRMDGPDSRETLHDHPWNFLSVVLRGGYIERVPPRAWEALLRPAWLMPERRRVRFFNAKRAEGLHYIESLLRVPTWTFLFVGRRRRQWGYVDYVDGEVAWTAFDEHPHNDEFEQAMKIRNGEL